MKQLRIGFIVLVLVFLTSVNSRTDVLGQIRSAEPENIVESDADAACELNSSYLDMLVAKAKKTNDRVFVISRLNKTENFSLNRIRLTNASIVLTDGKGLPQTSLVTAIGDKITSKKTGRLEFYLGSHLFLVSEVKKNKLVCMTCCETP